MGHTSSEGSPADAQLAFSSSGRPGSLPPQPTSFVGREQEVAKVRRMLADRDCRLLTLVGPGGSGKTRLAVQAAAGMVDGQVFTDGVYFVPLQATADADGLITAIADALPMSLAGQREPQEQLVRFLRDKTLLFLLDNFEQLLDGRGVSVIDRLLKTAHGLTLLITSRGILQLQQEWLYRVHGMAAPHAEDERAFDSFDAVRLFVERARRVHPQLAPAEERTSIARICRLVEGMPLAIELAASWRRVLRCSAIAEEIERGIGILESDLRNWPDRHRSMQAVFDYSWRLLDSRACDVLAQLTVFRGGFGREAAEAVAGASLSILSTLLDKSLLRSTPDGRYQMHELLRQYAQKKLEGPQEDGARDRHCTYYVGFLGARRQGINGGRQSQAVLEIEAEIDNVRAAWRWAVGQANVKAIGQAVDPLYLFYQFRSHYREGAEAFGRAVQALEQQRETQATGALLADLFVCLGYFNIRLGQLERGERLVRKGQALYERLDVAPPATEFGSRDPLIPLGILATLGGDHARAAEFGERARRRSVSRQDKGNLKFSYYLLANAALDGGDVDKAGRYAREAFELAQEMGDRWGLAYFHNLLGSVADAQGDYQAAKQHFQASYEIRQAFRDAEGMALALNKLGKVARSREAHEEADQLYRQAVELYSNIGDRGGLATALSGLGGVCVATHRHGEARRRLQRALKIAAEMKFVPLQLSILIEVAELMLKTDQQTEGNRLLQLAHDHPASNRIAQERARQTMQRYDVAVRNEPQGPDEHVHEDVELETVVRKLIVTLEIPQVEAGPPAEPASMRAVDETLVEPLTERQRQVLELLAEGLSNKEIAERLVLTVGTVKWHTNQLYGKLAVQSRTQAVARARELGLLS